MTKLMLTVATAALGLGMALPGHAQTLEADCKAMFETADINKDGSLGMGEHEKFVVLMSTKPKDASAVTMEEFLAECRKDAFKGIQEASVTPDTNLTAKSSSDATSTTATTAEAPAVSAGADATVSQPATATDQPAAVAEQPAATTTDTTTAASQDTTVTQPAAVGEASTTAEATTVSPSQTDVLASKLIGTTVVSIDNQNIGEINDLVIDVENQQAAQAIIGVGGFLGLGEKNVAVDLKRLSVRTDINSSSWTIVMDTTEDELRQLPEYKAAAAN